MAAAAPRIHPVLVAALEQLDRLGAPIADTNRRVGALAELIGQPRPSYQQVRVLVHAHRRRRLSPDARKLLLEIALMRTPRLTWDRLERL